MTPIFHRVIHGAFAGLLSLGVATTAAAQEKKPLVIGMAVAQSGAMTAYDGDPTKGFMLAVAEFNAGGGILGRKIKLVFSDTKSKPDRAFNSAIEVIEKGAEFVIASCDFDYGGPSAVAAQKRGVLVMSICSGSPKWGPQGVGELAFTAGHAGSVDGYVMAEWAFFRRGWKRAYMLKDTTLTYTRTQCSGFEQRWTEIAGKDSLKVDTFKNGDPSIATQITRLKNTDPKPEVIFICTYVPGGATALRQIRNSGIGLPIMGGFAMDGQYWTKSVPGLSDFYVPVYGNVFGEDPNPKVNEFVSKYKSKFGKPPTTSLALLGYAALQAYKIAAERAGSTGSQKIRAELEKFAGQELIHGRWWFSPKLHIQTRMTALINVVTNGKVKATGERYTNKKAVPIEMLFKE